MRLRRLLAVPSFSAVLRPRPDAGSPRSRTGMPLPAGTGLDRRSFLATSAGLFLAVYGGVEARPRRARRGDRAGAASSVPARQRVLVSVFLDGGADSMSILFPGGRPAVQAPPPDPRPSRARPASPSPRTSACAGTRPPRRSPSSTARARSASSRRSATRTRTSRTSPRATSGRSARPQRACAPAGSGATSTSSARRTTRSRASRSTITSSPRSRRVACPVATVESPKKYDFWARGVWGARAGADARRDRRPGLGPARPATRRSCRPPPPPSRPTSSAASSPPSRPERLPRPPSPTRRRARPSPSASSRSRR